MAVRCAAVVVAVCLAALPASASGGISDARVQQIVAMLPEQPAGLGRPISDRAAWGLIAAGPAAEAVIRRAEALVASPAAPLSDELFLDYSRTGASGRWEAAVVRRRTSIGPFVLAECLEDRGRFVPAVEELVRAICDARTWVMPAHDTGLTNYYGREISIDLAASDMACQLAHVDYVLGGRLSAETRRLLRENVRRRVLDPYLAMVTGERPRAWWMEERNNWNAVCLSGVTGAALAMAGPRAERALVVAAAEDYVRNYVSGFTQDGFCAEGLSYWNYGFGHFVLLAEEVRQATGGGVDLMALPKMRAVAQFAPKMEIVNGVYPAFADCPLGTRPDPRLLHYLDRRFALGLPGGETGDAGQPEGHLPEALMYTFPNAASLAPAPPPGEGPGLRSWFPDAVALVCRPAAGTRGGFGVAIMGSNNGESHNHNDVGSFVVVVGSRAVLMDPGREVYTSRTFGPQRYESTGPQLLRPLRADGRRPPAAHRARGAGPRAACRVHG